MNSGSSNESADDELMPSVGVIGGSGFYDLFDRRETVRVETPYGEPSAPVAIGDVAGRRVAFLPRHGLHHEFPPHRINYRANLWALRAVGVRRVLAPCAVGSLQPHLAPGAIVVPDQLVDRTSGRTQTYYDTGAVHVPFADPYCPVLRAAVCAVDESVVDGATVVVVEGPRFSTRAESTAYAASGWSLVNMTGQPEAALARELALCYSPIALVTDRDAGVVESESVSQEVVFAEFAAHVDRLRGLVGQVVAALPVAREGCRCAAALDGIALPFELP